MVNCMHGHRRIELNGLQFHLDPGTVQPGFIARWRNSRNEAVNDASDRDERLHT